MPASGRPIVRRVRFSDQSILVITKTDPGEAPTTKWYSQSQQDYLEHQFKMDVLRVQRRLTETQTPSLAPEEWYEFVGLENYMSREALLSTEHRRATHAKAVLQAQARQRILRARDANELALVSAKSSEWIATKCHEVAAMYWVLLDG